VSVYKRSYRPYSGPLTGGRTRFFVLVRYALSDVWGSRITNVLFVLCLIPTLFSMVTIYIMNNETVRLLISGPQAGPPIAIDERFFFAMMLGQYWPALALTAWVGPKLMATDMTNSALPIILSHPVSRLEYVLAKFTVLFGLLSCVTWVPALLLFAFQAHLSPVPWAMQYSRIASGMFAGGLVWITLLSLMALALASWVKWRIVATGMVVATMFVPAGMGEVFNAVMRTNLGSVINIPRMMINLWRNLIGFTPSSYLSRNELPVSVILVSLLLIALLCAAALNARVRAREVVRG